ncbi:MAG TPA: hypothetical protein ENG03_00325 [Thioploca sp.]|nr:MAG: hypothetical protein DRR19_11755 [Gammaproteobacteria bacterium]HDN25548.1 hypothetical protein [Thioploca sp.]
MCVTSVKEAAKVFREAKNWSKENSYHISSRFFEQRRESWSDAVNFRDEIIQANTYQSYGFTTEAFLRPGMVH